MNDYHKHRFEGKVAIVTGAASGIGLATARQLAQEGASVVIADLKEEAAIEAAKSIGNTALPVKCDVSNEDDVENTFKQTLDRFKQIDVIVNNAGLMIFKSIEEQSAEDWLRILQVDLMGAFFFIRRAFKVMKENGSIVNVSSIHAEETTPLVSSYAAAKSALVSLTKSAALEGTPKKIRVNAILPGAIDTPMLWKNPNVISGVEKIEKQFVGKPEDVASAIAFLASDDARFIQGAAIRIDGGRLDRL